MNMSFSVQSTANMHLFWVQRTGKKPVISMPNSADRTVK
jgi:S-adenosylhomocysteine hydrolase